MYFDPLLVFCSFILTIASICTQKVNDDLIFLGETTGLIAVATDTVTPHTDNANGDVEWEYLQGMKVIATVGEVDKTTLFPFTGYPDGHGAWLLDENTVRMAVQSESYGDVYGVGPTAPRTLKSGATASGSQVHTFDLDRTLLEQFLTTPSLRGADIIKASGHLYHTVFNIWGNEVLPGSNYVANKDTWGSEIKDKDGVPKHEWDPTGGLADFHQHSYCGSWYQPKEFYGAGQGFADDIYMMAEEWTWLGSMAGWSGDTDTQALLGPVFDAKNTIGLASVAVDVANEIAYVAAALGQTGYEKFMPVNPVTTEHVVIVAAGYNYGVEPAPLKIYVGVKGKNSDGTAGTGFLARNGLAFGKLYGLSITEATMTSLGLSLDDRSSKTEFMEKYLKDQTAPNKFDAKFFPTSYQFDGTVVNVGDTEMNKWQDDAEQPANRLTGEPYYFFNGDTKTEHPAVDPGPKSRFVQSMTDDGAYLAIDLVSLASELPAGGLPDSLTAKCVRLIGAWDGALVLTTAAVASNGVSASMHVEKMVSKVVSPDGLVWIKGSDGDILIADEDSGNDYGERRYAIKLAEDTDGELITDGAWLLALGGGSLTKRHAAGVSALPGAFSRATGTEFSDSFDISALVAKDANGNFLPMENVTGSRLAATEASIALNDKLLMGVLQAPGESGGQALKVKADQGGQLFVYKLNLP